VGGFPGRDYSHLEHHLASADALAAWTFAEHGAHDSFVVVLAGGVGALAKPADGAADGHVWARHEVAAWRVAQYAGLDDMVAATVLRELPSIRNPGQPVLASLQVLWPAAAPDADVAVFSDTDVRRAALFDAVIAHGDRRGHNWLSVPGPGRGAPPRLKLVDHGIGFQPAVVEPSSSFFDKVRGLEMEEAERRAVSELLSRLPGDLDRFLDAAEINAIADRARQLQAMRRFSLS
jgi:hypothetical protein